MPWTEPEHPTPVRAKFYVQEVALQSWGTRVVMNVVTRGEDNKKWSAATPSGQLTMMIANPLAAEQFWFGQEWFLTLDPIPKEQVGQEGME